MDKKELGYFGEKIIADKLINDGYSILKQNFSIKGGEIDIIAVKDGIIAFVEVKTRQIGSMVGGLEAVTKSKQKLIIKTAAEYLYRNPNEFQPRFDIAEVQVDGTVLSKIEYIENAYDTSGYNIIF